MNTKLIDFTHWAKKSPQPRYTALMELLCNSEGLRESFDRQTGNKAADIDGMTKADYTLGLDTRLAVLSYSRGDSVATFPEKLAGRFPHCVFRGLLSVHSRYGLHTREVTYMTLYTRRLQPFRYLYGCSNCFRLERELPGGIRTR